MQLKFYACPHCGNQLLFLNRTQPPAPCCCRAMEELHPNPCGSPDVHIPVVTQTGGGTVVVDVSRRPHPMVKEHYIEWVCLQTRRGFQVNYLKPGDAPRTTFLISPGDAVVAAYAYCNIHLLWKA